MNTKSFHVLVALFTVVTVQAQKTPYGNNPAAGKYYSLRGIQLYVETYGSGKPLVLLHGNGGSIASMSSIIPFFAKNYQVVAVDSRAQGKSTDKQDSLSFEMMSDDVYALLGRMKIAKADFIGWSDGGIVALIMGMRHPDKVKKIAATGANIWPDSTAFPADVWLGDKRYHDSVQYLPRRTPEDKKAWKLFLLDWLQPNIRLDQLRKMAAPCLIICGDHDVIRLEHTATIFRNIPNAQLWVVPHSGHATLIEHPKAFCEVVDGFLSGRQ